MIMILLPVLLLSLLFISLDVRAAVDLRVSGAQTPVSVYVTVTNDSGNPVKDLGAEDFRLFEDGLEQTPTVSPPPANSSSRVSIVFLMDYSGSMQKSGMIPVMEEATIDFINNKMEADDLAAIIKFNNEIEIIQTLTSDKSLLVEAVQTEFPGTKSRIIDAVGAASQLFIDNSGSLPEGPHSIIVISDGEENGSATEFDTMLDNANQSDASIFTLGVGELSSKDTNFMQSLSDATGGEFKPSPNSDELQQSYIDVANRLQNEYLLTYASSFTESQCDPLSLEVQVDTSNGAAAPETASTTFSRCFSEVSDPTPSQTSRGGAFGLFTLLAALALLGLHTWYRRRKVT